MTEKIVPISIPNALKNMDGIFGCKVSLELNQGDQLHYIFSKKTILDILSDIFSSDEEKAEKQCDAMLALRQIATELKGKDVGDFNILIKKYEENGCVIDFREVRKAIKKSLGKPDLPVVMSRPEETGPKILETLKKLQKKCEEEKLKEEELKENEQREKEELAAEEKTYKKEQDGIDKFLGYSNNTDKNDQTGFSPVLAKFQECLAEPIENTLTENIKKPAASKKFFPKNFSNSQSEKEEFEKIYRYRIGEGIRNKTYMVEVVGDADGDVSDDNLEALAETVIATELLTKEPIRVTIKKELGEFDALSYRLYFAFIDAEMELGRPFPSVQLPDLQTLKKEVGEHNKQYGTAHLNVFAPARTFDRLM